MRNAFMDELSPADPAPALRVISRTHDIEIEPAARKATDSVRTDCSAEEGDGIPVHAIAGIGGGTGSAVAPHWSHVPSS